MSERWIDVAGVVVQGHQVASRPSEHYPAGTISMQVPFFKQLGLDLQACYPGTLNVSVAPLVWTMRQPRFTFRQVTWTTAHPPEDFSFARCQINFQNNRYDGWIYYPHPETKARHFQNPSLIEVLAPRIDGIAYGDPVTLAVPDGEVVIKEADGE